MPLLLYTLGLAGLTGAGLALFTRRVARRVEAAFPPRGRFLDVDGCRLHYLERGSGPPVLLIHGLGGQSGHFEYALVERLAEDFRVIVVDRPGSGHSTRPRGASARLGAQAQVIARFVDALGLERPLLVGHSLGGAVALALALDHPEKVAGLALIAPLTHIQERTPEVFKGLAVPSPLLRTLIGWTVATPSSILRRERMLEAIFGPDEAPRDYATAAGGLLSLRPRSFVSASIDLLAANHDIPGMIERYPSLKVPVGVLFGTGDRILDHRVHGEGIASRVPGLELELVDGGHMLPLTAPGHAAGLVRRTAQRAGLAGV